MKKYIVHKLLAISLVSILIIYSIANYYSYITINRILDTKNAEQIALLENRLSSVVSISLWFLDYNQIQKAINAETNASLVSYIEVINTQDEKVASTTSIDLEQREEITIPLYYLGKTDKQIGRIIVKLDSSAKDMLAKDLIESFLVQLFFSMVIISFLLFSYCQKLITIPLGKLESAMNYIADGTADLSQRLQYQDKHNEISRVSANFNRIIEKIEDLMLTAKNKNVELSETIEKLNQMQDMLVESEKMASLGSLVAGVAHEVNTPIGIGITATSSLLDEILKLNEAMANKTLSSKMLTLSLSRIAKATQLTLDHLYRVSNLISSFKQVAVDQSIDDDREINLKQYIGEIYNSLQPRFKHSPIIFSLDAPEKIILTLNPGVLAQVLSNLIINAYIHAFEENQKGHINLSVKEEQDQIWISIKDDGKGMGEDALKNVFEPFYTTQRHKGGTGLGTNIVYNIINHKFGGTIHCESTLGEGSTFIFSIPKCEHSEKKPAHQAVI
jgi:two-component system NtrC family sensor kinase